MKKGCPPCGQPFLFSVNALRKFCLFTGKNAQAASGVLAGSFSIIAVCSSGFEIPHSVTFGKNINASIR